MVRDNKAMFMDIIRYDPDINMDKLKVNKFIFSLKFNICAKVRILMPQTLHIAV